MRSISPASNEDLNELHSQYVHVQVSSPDDHQFIVYTEWDVMNSNATKNVKKQNFYGPQKNQIWASYT